MMKKKIIFSTLLILKTKPKTKKKKTKLKWLAYLVPQNSAADKSFENKIIFTKKKTIFEFLKGKPTKRKCFNSGACGSES